MAEGLKDYIVECFRQAPSAYRRGAIVATILANAFVAVALYLGWHLNSFTALQLASAAVVIAGLEISLLLPYRLWKSNKAEIAALKEQYAGARKELWLLREQGVNLRNDGKTTRLVAPWTQRFQEWHTRVLEQASLLSMDLRHALDPVDKIAAENVEQVAVAETSHQINVSVMSEILARLYLHLSR